MKTISRTPKTLPATESISAVLVAGSTRKESNLRRHKKTCDSKVQTKYTEGAYHVSKTVFGELEMKVSSSLKKYTILPPELCLILNATLVKKKHKNSKTN